VRDSFGIDAQSFIGKTKQELGFPEHIASLYTDVAQEVFDHGEERSFDFVAHGGQTPRHFSTRILPEFEHDGRIDSVLVITYDVTERTLAQLKRDALLIREQAARAQAEASTRARDQFLAIVSHELRSPLNGIQSWTHVLENRVGGDSPSIARAIAGIKTGVQQQVRLIENLLDATQVMSGKLSLVKEPFLVRPAIQAAIDSVARDAAERNITIRTEFPPHDIQLTGNAQRVEQIVANLLTNALKFSVPGADVDVALISNESEACITIKDTGKGISAEFMPYLFDPFLQADGSNTRRAEGLGLGLTLVQRLAELHGGRITAQSAGENQGSVFSVRLPLQASTPEAALDVTKAVQPMQNSLSVSLADVRVLLVDDQQEARDSLAELLRQRGANVIALESGLRAVDYLGLVKSGGMPHVIICDIAMPEQDGYATLQKIRQMEKREPERFPWLLSAIALTAFGQHDDRMKALASGFQVYLTKPANPFELVSVVEILAHKATAGRVLQNAH
jgi:signal transduction histidine kinase/FixJ family two-component response regulator